MDSAMFGENQTVYQHKHPPPAVKHRGGGVMIWACFTATGPGQLVVIEVTTNFSVYQSILEPNVKPSVWQLKLGRNWVQQQDYDPKKKGRKESRCCNGPVKVQTLLLKCCGETLKDLRMNLRSNTVKKSGVKFFTMMAETNEVIQETILLLLQATESQGVLSFSQDCFWILV